MSAACSMKSSILFIHFKNDETTQQVQHGACPPNMVSQLAAQPPSLPPQQQVYFYHVEIRLGLV